MSKAALFFDIDGTILSEFTGRIPDSALRAFEEARKAGHLLFINTGRTMCSLPAEIRRLPFDGFLCGCGSYLTYRDEVLFEKHLELRRAEQIAREAQKCRIDGVFEGVEDVYFFAGVSRFSEIESMRRYMELRGLGVERYLEQGGCAFDKMYINVDALSDKEQVHRSQKQFLHQHSCLIEARQYELKMINRIVEKICQHRL